MQTRFTAAQLADPDVAESERILRKCVHCGFCTATCPTYNLLGDELDSPRGRIYLIKEMLENDRPADERTVRHIDRCLSCLSCMTTCPSGVNYMHLVDHARAHIEKTYRRPLPERLLRDLLAFLLPRPGLFRLALNFAVIGRGLAGILPGRLKTVIGMAPPRVPPRSPLERQITFPAAGERRARVALLTGCVQRVLDPAINEATVRLLNRLGVEVVVPTEAGCCGALTHHMGRTSTSHRQAAQNIRAWDRDDIEAVIINASGCGTTVKDYGYMFREDGALAAPAQRVTAKTRDITEFLAELGLPAPSIADQPSVAYHSACSMQHGQQIKALPVQLLKQAGFATSEPLESHLCCGSAGTYNLLQPEIATRLRDRKLTNITALKPQVIATGNIGCMTQLSGGTDVPVVHTVQLLDWATGGPRPGALGS